MSKQHKEIGWYRRHIEKAILSVTSLLGVKRLASETSKKIQHLRRSNLNLLNEFEKIKKGHEKLYIKKKIEEAVISQLGEGMIAVDEHERIVLMNKRAKDMLGIDSKEKTFHIRYNEYLQFCHGDKTKLSYENDPIYSTLQSNTHRRITLSDDIYCVRKDASIFPVTASISPFAVDSTTRAVIMTLYDATSEKQTIDIRSDFVTVASHQLKTPLTISNIHTEMLLKEYSENPLQESHLQEILFGNKKIEELLNKFFVISKIDNGSITVRTQKHEINEIVDDILHELSMEISHKKITITKEYETGLKGCVDWVLARIALHNIISNAVKYTPQGGSVTIRTRHAEDSTCVCVSDTGCGIPKDEHEQVFMKFYRTEHGAKNAGGSGVGLYITKSIIEQCKGKIWFESEVDKGTVFHITLPDSCE